MDWSKIVTWPLVALACALLATIVTLVLWGHVGLDDIGMFLTTVVGAMLLAQQKAARDQATRIENNGNGRLTSLLADNAELHRMVAVLAAKLPQDTPLPKPLAELEDGG